MKPNRMLRVNELLRRELGLLCERDIMPQIGRALVTIVAVNTSPDLRQATVRYSVYGDAAERPRVARLLHQKRVHLQHELSRNITMRNTPVLTFELDQIIEKADHVLEIIDQLELPPDDSAPAREPADS